jgi:N utilization substance protein A
MAALHAIEVDRGMSVNELLETIKSALLTAYRHTQGHQIEARIEIDRKTGVVRVIAREVDDDGNVISEWDDTPEGFGRIAATTARQVMLQRFRDAENERTYGEFSTREGEIVAGVIQRDSRANARGLVVVRIGSETGLRRSSQPPNRVRREAREHGNRKKCCRRGRVSRGGREPPDPLSRTHSQPGASCPAKARDTDGSVDHVAWPARHRPSLQDRGVTGSRLNARAPSPVRRQRPQRDERVVRGEDRHHHYDEDQPASSPARRRRQAVSVSVIEVTARAARVVVPTSSCRWPSARRARTRRWLPGSGMAYRHRGRSLTLEN